MKRKILIILIITLVLFSCNDKGDITSPFSNRNGTSAFECVSAYLYCDEQKRVCLQNDASGGTANCGGQYHLCITNLVMGCLDDMDPDDKNHIRM
ncbi:hypothetical protein AB3N59_10430 [Leptospira sp. WS92.C1]